MIRFDLKCSNGHVFDSWFASGQAFETLQARGMVSCAVCGETDVQKSLMAPQVRTTKGKAVAQARTETDDTPVSLAKPTSKLEAAIAELRAKVEANSDYVGKDFAKLARKMHDGESESRAIHGEANMAEARALVEDGVPILPLPFGPKQKAN